MDRNAVQRETGIRFLTTRPSEIEAASYCHQQRVEAGGGVFEKPAPKTSFLVPLPRDSHHGGFFL